MSDDVERVRELVRQRVAVFYDDDLPSMATHAHQASCGYSLYRGVLVQWDEDQDARVLQFLDDMEDEDIAQLLVVQEHEGVIAFLWDRLVPAAYRVGDGVNVCGDYWSIVSSRCLVPHASRRRTMG